MELSDYREQLKALLAIREQLKDVNISHPQMCVVGDQSSGKSSLLQCLTGIEFPVHHGTCTKAPIVVECRHAEEVEFQVADMCGVWSSYGEDEVSDAMLKTQEGFVRSTLCTISEDEIRVIASGPHMVDMVVVDLPGIIHNGAGKDETVRLINKYIQPQETLIILVSEAKADAESLAAQALAEQYDPKGTRTLKVLTKFDTFDTQAAKERAIQWILDGEGDPLGPHGVVCRPKGEEYNPKGENRELGDFKGKRFGVNGLVRRLPGLYSELIKTNLPALTDRVHDEHSKVLDQLKEVGDKPPDSTNILRQAQNSLHHLSATMGPDITEHLSKLKDSVNELNQIIDDDWCNQQYKPDLFTAPFFKGEDLYSTCIRELSNKCTAYHKKFLTATDKIFKESVKLPSECLVFSSRLVSSVRSTWLESFKHEVARYVDATTECVRRLGKYGSMNSDMINAYLNKREMPHGLIEHLQKVLDPNADGGVHRTQTFINELKIAWDKVSQREADFQTTSKQNLTAAVRSHFEVESKTMLDVILKETIRLREWREEWINRMAMDKKLMDAAEAEDPTSANKRKHLLMKKEKLEECIATLTGL